eukprot:c15044_g1_i1 orf=45-806(+)
MEVLQSSLRPLSSLSLPVASPSSTRSSSFTPISSVTLIHKPSSDRPLQRSCTYSGSNSDLALHSTPAEIPSASIGSARSPKKTPILLRNSAAAGYATALAEIGQSKHILNLIHEDLKKLATFLQHKQLHSFLLNPSIHDTHKKNILTRLASDSAFVPYTTNLLNLIVDRKRTALLKDVVKEFEVIYNQIVGTDVTVVLSATEIVAPQHVPFAKKIQSMSGAKNARTKNVLDASLVMGYIVKDASHLFAAAGKG